MGRQPVQVVVVMDHCLRNLRLNKKEGVLEGVGAPEQVGVGASGQGVEEDGDAVILRKEVEALG